jgi:hypothetical protein
MFNKRRRMNFSGSYVLGLVPLATMFHAVPLQSRFFGDRMVIVLGDVDG